MHHMLQLYSRARRSARCSSWHCAAVHAHWRVVSLSRGKVTSHTVTTGCDFPSALLFSNTSTWHEKNETIPCLEIQRGARCRGSTWFVSRSKACCPGGNLLQKLCFSVQGPSPATNFQKRDLQIAEWREKSIPVWAVLMKNSASECQCSIYCLYTDYSDSWRPSWRKGTVCVCVLRSSRASRINPRQSNTSTT